jgi:hypothetical protein
VARPTQIVKERVLFFGLACPSISAKLCQLKILNQRIDKYYATRPLNAPLTSQLMIKDSLINNSLK